MELSALIEKIETLRQQIRGYRERRTRLTESDTLRVLILPLLKVLGWDLDDLDEVKSEYRHTSSDNPVDYALFLQRLPVLFVEAKALAERLDERKPLTQTLNYANVAGVDWCVLTNGAEFRIYKVHAPVEAEEKLFLTVTFDDDEPADVKAQKLALISRDRMRQRDIDALWIDWRIDRQVQAVLEAMPEDDAFVRLLARKLPALSQSEIRSSLRRASLGVDYPDIGPFFDGRPALPKTRTVGRPKVATGDSQIPPAVSGAVSLPATTETAPTVSDTTVSVPNAKLRLPKTADLFKAGLLTEGMVLQIKDRPGSEATVIDGRHVEFRGERLSYNAWGCAVTGWVSIQIYTQALLQDGRLLHDLRRDLTNTP